MVENKYGERYGKKKIRVCRLELGVFIYQKHRQEYLPTLTSSITPRSHSRQNFCHI
jgi:hypothetical protein